MNKKLLATIGVIGLLFGVVGLGWAAQVVVWTNTCNELVEVDMTTNEVRCKEEATPTGVPPTNTPVPPTPTPGAFSPDDISGLKLWLEADGITGLNDGDSVATWNDQSASNLDVSQSVAGRKPKYETNELNGKPIVRFDSGDALSVSLTLSQIVAADAADIFVVLKQDGNETNNTTFQINAPDATNRLNSHMTWSNSIYFDMGDINSGARTSVAQPSGWDNAFHYVELYRPTSDAVEILVDGVVIKNATFTDDIDITKTATFAVGAETDAGANGLRGDIAVILIYNRALTATERQDVEDYFTSKYGL